MIQHKNEISVRMMSDYLDALVNRFYKILPIKESGENTMRPYLDSLLREMIGARELMDFIQDDDRYLSLLAIVQYFINNDVDVAIVRTDVFRAISILKKLQKKYFWDGGETDERVGSIHRTGIKRGNYAQCVGRASKDLDCSDVV